ncbi:MAG: 4-hydroxythreonine-4-phosphate dehydrogenase PdxA [Planctomycetota bacterium]
MPGAPQNLPPVIALTMGDPAGIGPEIVAAVLADPVPFPRARLLVVGSEPVFRRAEQLRHYPQDLPRVAGEDVAGCPAQLMFLHVEEPEIEARRIPRGGPDPLCGKAALAYLSCACDLVCAGAVQGLVTAPMSKEAVNLAGVDFSGHTEYLARRLAVSSFAMLQHSPELAVAFVTTHVPLREVLPRITADRILEVARLTDSFLSRLEAPRRRLAVCGLNPHAGEGGFMGTEEVKIIGPAVESARRAGIDIEGPFPPDTMFMESMRPRYDAAIAMYHDQGHIPFKMLAFDHGVNVTLGLPVVRTSPDHGTAFDIAWTGRASTTSLRAALELSARLLALPEKSQP